MSHPSSSTAPAALTVRLLPVPNSDPPGTGEHTGERIAVPHGQQVLALGEASPWWAPQQDGSDPAVAAEPSTDDDLDDPAPICRTLAGAMVEVLGGRRPVAQMTRWTTEEVHAELARRAALVARLQPADRRRRAVVRSTRVCRPAEGVVEACAVVIDNERARAVAFRLEGWDRRWRITAAEIG